MYLTGLVNLFSMDFLYIQLEYYYCLREEGLGNKDDPIKYVLTYHLCCADVVILFPLNV